MAQDKTKRDDEDLTAADRVILRLYESTQDPIDWDESDDAILGFAKESQDAARDSHADVDEAEAVVLELYDRGRDTIPWDAWDESILTYARSGEVHARPSANQSPAIGDDDMSEADRAIYGLYEQTKQPIAWDGHDDAILAYAKNGVGQDMGRDASVETVDAPTPKITDEATDPSDDTVVRFQPRRRSMVGRIVHSPVAGFAMAASLLIGMFVGQGVTPYLHLGVSPDYNELAAENAGLAQSNAGLAEENARLAQQNQQLSQPRTRALEGPVGLAGFPLKKLTSIMDDFDCARLGAHVEGADALNITGYVSRKSDVALLRREVSDLSEQVAVNTDKVLVRDWPFCETLQILHRFTVTDASVGAAPMIRPVAHTLSYVEGETLLLEATATSLFDSYVYVDFIQGDGSVRHLTLAGRDPTQAVPRGQAMRIGDGPKPYEVVAPFGTEMITIISSSHPLFAEPRPEVENAQSYFAHLRRALVELEKGGEAQVLSDHIFLEFGPGDAG